MGNQRKIVNWLCGTMGKKNSLKEEELAVVTAAENCVKELNGFLDDSMLLEKMKSLYALYNHCKDILGIEIPHKLKRLAIICEELTKAGYSLRLTHNTGHVWVKQEGISRFYTLKESVNGCVGNMMIMFNDYCLNKLDELHEQHISANTKIGIALQKANKDYTKQINPKPYWQQHLSLAFEQSGLNDWVQKILSKQNIHGRFIEQAFGGLKRRPSYVDMEFIQLYGDFNSDDDNND